MYRNPMDHRCNTESFLWPATFWRQPNFGPRPLWLRITVLEYVFHSAVKWKCVIRGPGEDCVGMLPFSVHFDGTWWMVDLNLRPSGHMSAFLTRPLLPFPKPVIWSAVTVTVIIVLLNFSRILETIRTVTTQYRQLRVSKSLSSSLDT